MLLDVTKFYVHKITASRKVHWLLFFCRFHCYEYRNVFYQNFHLKSAKTIAKNVVYLYTL